MSLTINDPVSEVRSESKIFLRNAESFSPGLRVNRNPRDDACFEHVQTWLRECVEHGCRKVEGRRLPTRLIEVPSNRDDAPRLYYTHAKELGQYLALSHCWGKAKMTTLLSGNELQWKTTIDLPSLSQNFKDALEITRRLGFKYIWIDALCILQDSVDDWARESPKMASIYNNAVLVISATSAMKSEAGILNHRPALCSPPLGVGRTHYFLDPKYLVGEYGNGRESPLSVLADLPLNKRGWAAQERVMAARILHYTTYEMIWECTHSCLFESNYSWESSHALGSSHSTKLLFNKGLFNKDFFMEPPLQGKQGVENSRDQDIPEQLRAWFICVQEFSPRDLTFPSDKLPAVAGLVEYFDWKLGEYLVGLWNCHLPRSLAWETVPGQRRPTPEEYRAPSWSWASIDGGVSYAWDSTDCAESQACNQTLPWLDQYKPHFIENNILLKHPLNPYMGVLKGSHLLVDGNCLSHSLVKLYESGSGSANLVLCDLRPDTSDDEKLPYSMDKLVLDGRDFFFMQLRWRSPNENPLSSIRVLALLLQATDKSSTAFRRLGIATIDVREVAGYVGDTFKTPMSLEESYASLGWKRQTLKLV